MLTIALVAETAIRVLTMGKIRSFTMTFDDLAVNL
jgi:hypothetical protein